MKVFTLLIVPALYFSMVLITPNGFVQSTSFEIWNGNGFSVISSDSGLGLGYDFKDENTIYSEVRKGFLKLRLRTGWERFDFQLIHKEGIEISSSYKFNSFTFGVSKIFKAFQVGEDGFTTIEDSFSSVEMLGFGFMSRKFEIKRKGFVISVSMNAFKYLDLSLGTSYIDGKRILGFFIPTKRFSNGFLMGIWWEDGIAFGSCGKFTYDLSGSDLEVFGGFYVKGEDFNFDLVLSLNVKRVKTSLFVRNDGIGVLLHE